MLRAARAPSSARQLRRRIRRRRRRIVLASLFLLCASVIVLLVVTSVLHRPRHSAALVQQTAVSARSAGALQPQLGFLHSGSEWNQGERLALAGDIRAIINGGAFPSGTGVLILDPRDGSTLYAHNPHLPLVPGSTMKLVTAAAALSTLGAGYRFPTSIVTDGTIADGTLAGNLWLIGGGDPELTTDDLRRAVHVLSERGIDSVTGNVYADGSLYGPDSVNATWQPDDLQYGWAAPAGALSLNENSVQFTITPQAGGEASVAIDPPGAAEHVIASVETVSADADNTLRIEALPDGSGYQLSGQIPYGAPQKYWRSVAHPTFTAAASLLKLLQLTAVTVQGSAAEDIAPGDPQVLWLHRSRPLEDVVQRMFFDSDNHTAEELLRSVGYHQAHDGTLHGSLLAERAFLARQHALHAGIVLADGSGLSAENRLDAQTLADALRLLARTPLSQPAYRLLPRAGIEGTVSVRDLTTARGRVYAKDGYIGGASTLAGYVLTAHHGPVVFAFLVNDWEHGLDAVWDGEDRILDELARY